MANKHSNEAFYALYDPLTEVVFSALVEILKEMDRVIAKMEGMWPSLCPFCNPDHLFRQPVHPVDQGVYACLWIE